MTPVQSAALAYARRGWVVLPLRPGDKMPSTSGWPDLRLVERDLTSLDGNLGIHLGPSGLVDIDLDCDEAVELGRLLLPPTPLVFGRQSRPAAHYLYEATGLTRYVKVCLGRETYCELRAGNGKQSMVPPSIHPSGEAVRWEPDAEPERGPAPVPAHVLEQAVKRIGAGVLLMRTGMSAEAAAAAVQQDSEPELRMIEQHREAVRKWCGWAVAVSHDAAPSQRAGRDLLDAIDAYHHDNPAEYPSRHIDCPVCGGKDAFKAAPSPPGGPARWSCWSQSHEQVGRQAEDRWFGDALDIAAHMSGMGVAEYLAHKGYLARRDAPQGVHRSYQANDASTPVHADDLLHRWQQAIMAIIEADAAEQLEFLADLVARSDEFGPLVRDDEATVTADILRLESAGLKSGQLRRLEMALRGARAKAVGVAGAQAGRQLLQRGDESEIADCALADHLGDHCVYDLDAVHVYDPTTGAWLNYERHHMVQVVLRYAGDPVLSGVDKDGQPQIKRLKISNSFANGASALIESKRRRRGFFDRRTQACGFADGVLTSDGEWCAKGPEHRLLSTEILPFDYYPVNHFDEAPALAPRWWAFLRSVWDGDSDFYAKVEALHQFLGCCLLGVATRQERALLLYGPTAGNGKSTLLKVISNLFPAAARCAVPPHLMGETFQNVPLATSRLNIVNDMPDADILDAGHLKAIISGDEIAFNPKNRSPFTARPRAGHVFATNNLPRVKDKSRGFWRRLLVLTFNNSFDSSADRDPFMAEKVSAEVRIIAGLACAAALTMPATGYTIPASSVDVSKVWQRAVDHVLEFAEECIVVGSDSLGTSGPMLYRAFKIWCQESGVRPLGRNKFYDNLRRDGWIQGSGANRKWLMAPREGTEAERCLRLAKAVR